MRFVSFICLVCMMVSGCSSGDSGGSGSSYELSAKPWLHVSEFDRNSRLHASRSQTVVMPIDDNLDRELVSPRSVHQIPYYLRGNASFSINLDTNGACIQEVKAQDATGKTILNVNLQNPKATAHLQSGRYLLTVTEVSPMPAHCSLAFMQHRESGAVQPAAVKKSSVQDPNNLLSQYPWLFDQSIIRMFGQLKADGSGYLVNLVDQFDPNEDLIRNTNTRLNAYQLGALIQAPLPQGCGTVEDCPIAYNSQNYVFNLYYDPARDSNAGSWMLQGWGYNYGLLSCMLAPAGCSSSSPAAFNDSGYLCGIDTQTLNGFPYQGMKPVLAFSNDIGMKAGGCYYSGNQQAGYYRFNLDFWDSAAKNPRDLAFGVYNSVCPLGNSCQWQFSTSSADAYLASAVTPFTSSLYGIMSLANQVTPGYDRIRLTELYRYYPDASKMKNSSDSSDNEKSIILNEGEVALFTGTDYTGEAVVLNADTSYPLLPIDFGTWLQVNSVLLGPNTATITFADGTTIGQNIKQVYPTYQSLQVNKQVSSTPGQRSTIGVNVFRAIDVIFSNDCPNCNLADVQISNGNFSNRNFSGAFFTRAKITGAIFDSANLSKADFTSASMSRTSGSVTTGNSFQKTNLTDAIMQGANFSGSNFKGANLCRAKLNQLGTTGVAAMLDGSYLQNANLAYADLSGASLNNVSFHSAPAPSVGSACIPDANCTVTSCAGAYKATMNATKLQNAYLAGASFASATLTRSDFTNAFALGTIFNGATFSNDTDSNRTIFKRAYLPGTDFTNATVQGVSFLGAYFDDPTAATNRIAISYLNSSYTGFMGYNAGGTTVCPQFTLKQPQVLPLTTDATVICPDGTVGPCQSSSWYLVPPSTALVEVSVATPYTMPAACGGTSFPFW